MSSDNPPTLGEALDDVEARFLYNLPLSELNQADRLFFQIEQAFWYYEDFKADKWTSLPHFANLKKFAVKLFNHCPLLSRMEDKFQELFSDFSAYKSKIPVFGCILLNPKMNKVVLVCDYNSKSWMFPRGKINEKESEYDCAIREVVEEIGYDPRANCKEEDNIMVLQDGKTVKLFIATNVPEKTIFNTQTRKEIGKIEFHALDNLPKNTYGVIPFIPKLKRWISKHSRMLKSPLIKSPVPQSISKNSASNASVSKKPRAPSFDKTTSSAAHPSPGTMKRLRNIFDQRNPDTFQSPKGSETPSDFSKGWSINDMFAANSKLTGLSYKYNGNPHEFGSSHPRFVDYRDQSNSTPSRSVLGIAEGTDGLMELHALSQQSLVGHRMMRLERGKEVDDLPDFALPTSAFSAVRPRSASNQSQQQQYRWTSAKLTPFVLDVADIMNAVDDCLLMSAQEVY